MAIKRILIALDLTEMDIRLVEYARYLSSLLPSLEDVVLVHNIKHSFPEEVGDLLQDLDRPLPDLIREDLDEKLNDHFRDDRHQTQTEIVIKEEESTAHAIADVARAEMADLILVGKKIDYLGTGIVPSKLLRLTDRPILFLPETAYYQIRNILVPTDFSKSSVAAMKMAIHFQGYSKANLSCQHVYHIPVRYFPYIPVESVSESMVESAEADYHKFLEEAGADPHIACEFTSAKNRSIVQNIHHYAIRKNVNFMVIGDRGHTMFVGSVADGLANLDMHIPLLVVSSKH